MENFMPIAVICTGTELLKGGCCNTNMFHLGGRLCSLASPPVMELSIGDHPDELCFALSCALQQADIIIVSGGLGPTSDDITLETVARFFGLKLVEVAELKEKVEKRWALRHNGHCPKFQYKQAMIVEGGKYFNNPAGTASGIAFETVYGGKKRFICLLPGPPAEFETVLDNGMLEDISAHTRKSCTTSGFFICRIGETQVARAVEGLFKDMPLEIAYTAMPGGTKLFISGENPQTVDAAIRQAHDIFGSKALDINCFDLPSALFAKLKKLGLTFACAESCTGGLAADSFVSLPGASEVFNGGIVSYANQAKMDILGVSSEILEQYGAVSPQCAEAMVKGVCKALKSNCAVSTTGIAGPDGGTPEKPVGLVYVAASVNNLTAVKELHLHGNRKMIRERTVANALQLLWELLDAPENNIC